MNSFRFYCISTVRNAADAVCAVSQTPLISICGNCVFSDGSGIVSDSAVWDTVCMLCWHVISSVRDPLINKEIFVALSVAAEISVIPNLWCIMAIAPWTSNDNFTLTPSNWWSQVNTLSQNLLQIYKVTNFIYLVSKIFLQLACFAKSRISPANWQTRSIFTANSFFSTILWSFDTTVVGYMKQTPIWLGLWKGSSKLSGQ
jgi:hypothetical protein